MANLSLTLACGPYDRTEALRNGAVQLEGIDLNYLAIQSPPEIFARMVSKQSFDVSEMSCSHYLVARSKGEFPFLALPVFPSRLFRHGFIFVNVKSGILKPRDLEGKRIGVPEYSQTAAVWIRGILQNDYGVDLSGVRWFAGGVNGYGRPEVLRLIPEGELSLDFIGDQRTLNEMLVAGEIDALIGARIPSSFGTNPDIQRLFPDYREEEKQYYRRTGIFPIMHTLVIKEDLYQRHPWIAETLYKGFVESKQWIIKQMRFSGASRYMLPWLQYDLDEMEELFGKDPWPYGLEPNRKNLETLAAYLAQQRFVPQAPSIDEMFLPVVTVGE
ncbi:MAG TPA: ABC transporter substrate-binding protein [Dehalococcoidia bacterium]|nr:ABC transporter substrate-binding protein [Dehalococcoidia bacterium]